MLGGWVNPHREQQTIPQGQTSLPPKSFFTPTANGQSAPRTGSARGVGRRGEPHTEHGLGASSTVSTRSTHFTLTQRHRWKETDGKVCTHPAYLTLLTWDVLLRNRPYLTSLAARYLEKKTRRFFDLFCAPPRSFPRVHPSWPDDWSKQAPRIKKIGLIKKL